MAEKAARSRWSNWAGTATCAPAATGAPADEDELAALVKGAAAEGQRVKAYGAGHSFTGAALTDGVHLSLDGMQRALAVERLALENLGDIAYQSAAGAINTSTHGTGRNLGTLSTQVRALRLVTGDGSVLECSRDEEPEVFSSARVGVGAMGVMSTVTLQCLPAFHLHAVEEPRRLDEVLEQLDELVDGNDHYEFFYVPHTGWALTKANNRTDEPLAPRRWVKAFKDDVVLANVAFGALCRAGRRRPSMVPRL